MANYKKTNVHYYQLYVPTKGLPKAKVDMLRAQFSKAIKFSKRNLQEARQGDGSVAPVKSEIINKRYIGGALIYTQETNIPPKWDGGSQKLAKIDITGFRGLGFDAAYFYDTDNMIIALESRVPGPSLESLRKLIHLNYTVPSFDFRPISSTNEYNKFIQSKKIRKVEIKMVNYDGAALKKGGKIPGIEQSKELVDMMDGSYITWKVAAGYDRSKTLSFQKIKQMADYAINSIGGSNEVTSFKVDIVDLNSGKLDPIDLITNRISDKIQIEKERTISKFSILEKIKQLEGHYLRRLPKLDKIYRL